MRSGGDFSYRASAPGGPGAAIVPEEHGDEVDRLQPTRKEHTRPHPTRETPPKKAAGGAAAAGGPRGAEQSGAPAPGRRRPALSRVLKPPRRLSPLRRLGAGAPAPACERQGSVIFPFLAEGHGTGMRKTPYWSMSPEWE